MGIKLERGGHGDQIRMCVCVVGGGVGELVCITLDGTRARDLYIRSQALYHWTRRTGSQGLF